MVAPENKDLAEGFARPVRVAVVFESVYMRLGCAAVLEQYEYFEVVHVAAMEDAASVEHVQCDLTVVGISSPHGPGAQAIQHLTERGECVIAVVSPRVAPAAALAVGAHAVVHGSDTDGDGLVDTVFAVIRGEMEAPARPPPSPLTLVSPRERQVLAELAAGKTDREIADALGISARTVQSHLDRIREKTDRRRRADLTVLAFDLGIANRREER